MQPTNAQKTSKNRSNDGQKSIKNGSGIDAKMMMGSKMAFWKHLGFPKLSKMEFGSLKVLRYTLTYERWMSDGSNFWGPGPMILNPPFGKILGKISEISRKTFGKSPENYSKC